MNYDIKRNGIIVATVRPEGGQQKEVMVQDIVPVSFKTSEAIHFMHGDYIDVWGERYTLNNPAEPTMNNENSFEYKLTFQAQYYALAKWKFKGYDSANQLTMEEWDLMSNPSGFLDLIVANANRLGSGWTKGEVLAADYQNLSFSGENILQALSQLAEAFETEWKVINKVIHLVKKVGKTGYKFSYGYNNGLRGGLTRINTDSSSVFSRLYVYGSDKNLPVNYRNGVKRLTLPNAVGYIQGSKYGADEIEASITFDDVMPDRIGTVTSVGATIYTFSDSSIDFDVNPQIYSSLSAKVEFQTGSLAGYQFEIAKGGYTHATRTVTFLKNDAETAFVLPSATLKPKVGDKYKFIDIAMPQSYVDAKEAVLMARGQEYFNNESAPKYTFGVPPDFFFFARNQVRLNLGDTARVTAFDLLLDADIRITGYTRDLHEEFRYTDLILSNTTVLGSSITAQIAKEEKIDKALAQNQVYDIARARRNAATLSEVKNFMVDPEGKYYGDMFRANSIETLSLAVGSKWTNFSLKGVSFNTNAGGNPNSFTVKAGQLVHYALQIDGLGFIWDLAPLSVINLDPVKTYYVYAKVSRNALTGTWVVTDQMTNVESISGFWHFQTGVLFAVTDGRRDYEFTHGMTYIIGDQITAGILKSLDGLNFINLTNGTANFGTTASGWDFGISAANKFSIRGALIQSGSGVVSPLPSYRGTYLPGTIYYKGDTVLYNGTQWIYVNDVSLSGQTPADNTFWKIYASSGTPGVNGLGSFTLVNRGGMTITGSSVIKSSATVLWDASVKSLEYYYNGASLNFTAVDATHSLMMGLNTDPDTDNDFASIDYALCLLNNGTIRAYESGVATVTGLSYVAGDQFSVVYNGKTVAYSKNGIVFRTVSVNSGIVYYFDSSFNTPGAAVSNITFAAVGAAGNYTQFIYQKNGSTTAAPALTVTDVNPVGWSTTQPALSTGEYLWMTSAVKSGADNSLTGTWAVPLRTNGVQGATGAALANTGNYSATKQYHGTALKVEAVFYNGNWYLTRTDAGTFSGIVPTNTTYWNSIGAQFDSIATGLLLANAATIDNLTVRNVKTSDTLKRIEINGDDNSMIFYDDTKTTQFPNGREVFRLDDNIDTGQAGNPLGGIMAKTPAGDVAYCTGNGLFANGAGMQFLSATTGKTTNASVVGIARYKNTDSNGITAGVVGFDQSDGTGNSKSYGMACIGNTLITGEVHLNFGGTIKGFTGYELISSSGPQTRKYINGFYIGQGPNDSW